MVSRPVRYKVRTLFLSNFFEPSHEMVELRRNAHKSNAQALIASLKRVELADHMLEKELNTLAEKGFRLSQAILHPQMGNDLVFTAIFEQDVTEW